MMGKVLHYGIEIREIDPQMTPFGVVEKYDYLATDEPCYRSHSNCWGFQTTDGKEMRINKDTIKAITWEAITE